MTSLIVLTLFGFTTVCLIAYYLLIFRRFYSPKKEITDTYSPPVSVIIAARNEQDNLRKYLPLILEQDYPEYEVIIVNDGSYDQTLDVLKELNTQYPHLRIVDLKMEEHYRKGKKFALTMGIKAARHEQLLFTDADCSPAGKNWIKGMMASSNDGLIVLGYAPLQSKHSLLGALIYYETFHTALQYMSYAEMKMAYMGVGRNLSYPKSLFFSNKGFASHQHLLSGDDDLFIQEVAEKHPVNVCTDPDTFMTSPAPENFSSYMKQKLRHLSTSLLYKARFKLMLGFYAACQILFYVLLAWNLAYQNNQIPALSILLFKWIVQWIVFFKPAKRLQARKVNLFLPYYDLLFSFYLLIFGLLKPFYKNKTWN